MLADLDADVADLAGDRRGQLEPVGPHQSGALLGKRSALGEQHRAGPAGLNQTLRALRLGVPQRRALGDKAFAQRFHLGASGKQGRARVLDLALAAGALPGKPGGTTNGRLGEIDLVRGEGALPLERADRGCKAGALLIEGGGLRRAGLRGQLDLPRQLGILIGQLLQLVADAVHPLRERKGHQRLAGTDDVTVADVELPDFGRSRRIDAGDAGVVGDDAAHPGGGRIAAENEDRDHDRHDRRDEKRVQARRRRHRRDHVALKPFAFGLYHFVAEKRCVHGPWDGIVERRRYDRDLNSRLIGP